MLATMTAGNGVELLKVAGGYLAASRSEPGTWHELTNLERFGVGLLCDCKGFENRGHCAHITAVCQLWKVERAAKAAERKAATDVEAIRRSALAVVADLFD